MRVVAAKPEDFGWLTDRTGCVATPNFRAIKAVDAEGRIRGMVGYCGWTANSCQAHMAVDAPIVWRSLLPWAFSYPFEELGLGIILGSIPAHNEKSVAMVTSLGFELVHAIRDGWDAGDDLLLFEMRRENCRWLSFKRKAA